MLSVLATSRERLGGNSKVENTGGAFFLPNRPAIFTPSPASPKPLLRNPPSPPCPRRPPPKPENRPFKLVKAELLFSSALVFAVSPEPRSCTALAVRFRACSTPEAELLPTPKLLDSSGTLGSPPVRNVFAKAPGRPAPAVNDRKTSSRSRIGGFRLKRAVSVCNAFVVSRCAAARSWKSFATSLVLPLPQFPGQQPKGVDPPRGPLSEICSPAERSVREKILDPRRALAADVANRTLFKHHSRLALDRDRTHPDN